MDLRKMRIISIIWGMILFSIVFLLTAFGFVYKNKIKKYEELENTLEEKVKQYVEEKFLYPEDDKKLKITFKELKEEGKMSELKADDEECDGYTIVNNNGQVFKYQTYIKCNNYQTKNYNKN